MNIVTGHLSEVSQSTTRGPVVSFLYIEIDGKMYKNIKTFNGLDGKLRLQLGEKITAYMDGNWIVAVKDNQERTYSSTSTGPITFALQALFIVLFGITVIGLIVSIILLQGILNNLRSNKGANLPGAIEIPRG